MRMLMVAVHDNGVQAFLPPMFVRAKGEALRGFIDACNDSKLPFGNHANDYRLFLIGYFDDSNARIEPVEPELLMRAIDVIMSAEKSLN